MIVKDGDNLVVKELRWRSQGHLLKPQYHQVATVGLRSETLEPQSLTNVVPM